MKEIKIKQTDKKVASLTKYLPIPGQLTPKQRDELIAEKLERARLWHESLKKSPAIL